MNDTFDIQGLGRLTYLVTLIDIDYPRAFVCKSIEPAPLELFVFTELDHGKDYLEWVCAQISVEDLDRLNCGMITLESCFMGPRKGPKSGFRVVSRADVERPEAVYVENISGLVKDHETFVDPFVADNHGADLRSLVYQRPILAVVMKQDKYADPFFESTRSAACTQSFNAMGNALPYAIDIKRTRMGLSQSHSLVMYFEVFDKKSTEEGQQTISDAFQGNPETRGAFEAIQSLLRSDSTPEQVINAFKGDTDSIKKTRDFIAEIKRVNPQNPVLLQTVDYSMGIASSPEPFCSTIDDCVVGRAKEKSDAVQEIVDREESHKVSEFTTIGQFLMLDTTGKKKFKFQSLEKGGVGEIVGGFSEADLNGITVDSSKGKTYKVKLKSDVLSGKFGVSKPIFTLLEIMEEVVPPEQLSLLS